MPILKKKRQWDVNAKLIKDYIDQRGRQIEVESMRTPKF